MRGIIPLLMNGFNHGKRVSKSGMYSLMITSNNVITDETIAVYLAACFPFPE
jgi:hypothetical protein